MEKHLLLRCHKPSFPPQNPCPHLVHPLPSPCHPKMLEGDMVMSLASPPYHPSETLNPDGRVTLTRKCLGSLWDVWMQETLPKSVLAGICHPGVHGQHLEEIIWLGSGWMVGVGERFMSRSLGCKSSCNWDFSLPSYPREAECSSCGARLRDG